MKNPHSDQVIAIIGATGFVGGHLIQGLLKTERYRLKILIHRRVPQEWQGNPRVEFIHGDLHNTASIETLLTDATTLINLSYLKNELMNDNGQVMRNILAAVHSSSVQKFIHLSTAILVGDVPDSIVNETVVPRPKNAYEKTKIELEKLILDFSLGHPALQINILRPTAVFGPRGLNLVKIIEDHRHESFLKRQIKGLLFQDRKMNLVSVQRVVESILYLAQNQVHEKILIISHDEDPSNNYRSMVKVIESTFALKPIGTIKIPGMKILLGLILRLMGQSNANPDRAYSHQLLDSHGHKDNRNFINDVQAYLDWYKENH